MCRSDLINYRWHLFFRMELVMAFHFPDGYMGYVNNGTERTNDEYKYKLQYLSFSFPMVGNAV